MAGNAKVAEGDRVAAFCFLGGFAEQAVAPAHMVFPLSDELDARQGAGLILNYHTAYFALRLRGRLAEGDKVLVHGAAGGVGTASIQVAKGLGASQVIGVVSSDEKEQVARDAGADEVVRSDQNWREQAQEVSGGGVDLVLDPVGGDRFTDSLRALRRGGPGGRRRLHRRLDPRGQGQPPAAEEHGGHRRRLGRLRDEQAEGQRRDPGGAGRADRVRPRRPIVGARYPLEQTSDALELLDGRGAMGKVVLEP